MKWKKLDRNFMKYLISITAAVLIIVYSSQIYQIVQVIMGVIMPLLIGCAIAYVLNIILVRLERIWFPKSKRTWIRKSRRGICIFLALALVLLVVVLLLNVIIPELWDAIVTIGKAVPILFERVKAWFIQNADAFPSVQELLQDVEIDWAGLMEKISQPLTQGVNGIFNTAFGAVSSVVGFLFNIVVSIIFALYLLASKERLGLQIKRAAQALLPVRVMRISEKIAEVADDCFTSFFIGQFVEAIILGSLCFIGMSILRFPYASMIGTLIGATALIPILGAYIGAALGALLICLVSPLKALEFLLFIVILQQLEGNLIYPRVVGTSIGLPGIWVFSAVMIGSGLFGIPGVLLGVPVVATMYKLLRIYTESKEQKKEAALQEAKALDAQEAPVMKADAATASEDDE